MRRTSVDLDAALDAPTGAQTVSVVTRDFAYTTLVDETVQDSGTAFSGHLSDVAVDLGDAVLAIDNPNDFIAGTDGNDVLDGGDGNDLIAGGLGDDMLSGGTGEDTLVGDLGNDTLDGGDHADWLLGAAGDDHLLGGSGDDVLEGGAGNDRLVGGPGNDVMKGGEGGDTLVAGSGFDTMIGGAGRDIFVVNAGGYHYGGLDRITDFEARSSAGHYPVRMDMIKLGEALQGSTFAGTSAVEAFQQGYIYLKQTGQPGDEDFGTTVYMDRNGHAADYGYYSDVALVKLDGVAANELVVHYYNSNFIL